LLYSIFHRLKAVYGYRYTGFVGLSFKKQRDAPQEGLAGKKFRKKSVEKA
jgi:hypothetical protein